MTSEEKHCRSERLIRRQRFTTNGVVTTYVVACVIAAFYLDNRDFASFVMSCLVAAFVAILTTAGMALRAIDRIHSTRSKS